MNMDKSLAKKLFEKYKTGEKLSHKEQAGFKSLNDEFSKIIKQTCSKTITYKGAHRLLTGGHEVQLEDLESIVWQTILTSINDDKLPKFFENPEGHVSKIAKNKTIDFMRKIIKKHKHNGKVHQKDTIFLSYEKLLEDNHDGYENPNYTELSSSELSLINSDFNYLDQNEKDIILLKGLGYTKKEISENLEVSEKTVYNRLNLIKTKIKANTLKENEQLSDQAV